MRERMQGRLMSRGMVLALVIIGALVWVVIFGNFEKPIPEDRAAAMVLINKMGGSNSLLSGCEFDSGGHLSKCQELDKRLGLIRKEGEEIIATRGGELVGVNFQRRVVVVLRPIRGSDGRIGLSCSVWPENATPRGCGDAERK